MQKSLPTTKLRREKECSNSFFEDICAGCITAGVDCDLETFQTLSRVVRSKISKATFRPELLHILSSPCDLEEAEIVFGSLVEIAEVLDIRSLSDLLTIAIRERHNTKRGTRRSQDTAIRVVGTYLLNEEDEKAQTAILVCTSIHEGSFEDHLDAFVGKNREFDFEKRSYRHRLQQQRSTAQSLLASTFASQIPEAPGPQQTDAMLETCSQLRNFCLRWHPIPTPNVRTWTRALAVSEVVNGILELDIPFVTFRGTESTGELTELNISSFTKTLLTQQVHGNERP